MNRDRFYAANAFAFVTHLLVSRRSADLNPQTQPLDLIKTRSQMLQEGKTFTGLGFQRGIHPGPIYREIANSGPGYIKFYTSYEGFALKTLAYTNARLFFFGYFYDWVNPDSRRVARADYLAMAGMAGGTIAGIITNPIEVVFTRMQVDEMYPESYRRNYSSFYDGFVKCLDEGALWRGALCNGLKIGTMISSMTHVNDWCKENSYFFLGPHFINRLWATAGAVGAGTLVSMPFDTIRMRLSTMRPLPNGKMPYENMMDCAIKIAKYESSLDKNSNGQSLYSGFYAYYARWFVICYGTQIILDWYHSRLRVEEYWQPARYNFQGGIDMDVHDPWTMAFHKGLTSYTFGQKDWMHGAMHPHGKGSNNLA